MIFCLSFLFSCCLCAIVFDSVTIEPTTITAGTDFILTILVTSSSPPSFLTLSLDSSVAGNVEGGGGSVTPIAGTVAGEWALTRTWSTSAWTPPSTLTVSMISVENEAEETASFSGTNASVVVESAGAEYVATKPVVESVSISPGSLETPGVAVISVAVRSNAPPSFLTSSGMVGSRSLWGGGMSTAFQRDESDDNLWHYEDTNSLSLPQCAEEGVYVVSGVYVANEGYLESDVYSGHVNVTVTSPSCTATGEFCDVIAATAVPESVQGGGSYDVRVTVHSSSKPDWLSYTYTSPTGKPLLGGGGSLTYTKDVANDTVWTATTSHTVSPFAPRGNYVWTDLGAQNEQGISSNTTEAPTLVVPVVLPLPPAGNVSIVVDSTNVTWQDDLLKELSAEFGDTVTLVVYGETDGGDSGEGEGEGDDALTKRDAALDETAVVLVLRAEVSGKASLAKLTEVLSRPTFLASSPLVVSINRESIMYDEGDDGNDESANDKGEVSEASTTELSFSAAVIVAAAIQSTAL